MGLKGEARNLIEEVAYAFYPLVVSNGGLDAGSELGEAYGNQEQLKLRYIIVESQNGVGEDLKAYPVPIPCLGQGCHSLGQAAQRGLEHLQG